MLTRKRLTWIAISVMMSLLILAGCGQKAEQPAAAGPSQEQGSGSEPAPSGPPRVDASGMVDTTFYKKDGPYKIGFSNISVVNTWRVQMVRELEAEARRQGVELIVTDANGDLNKQIADVEDLLAQGIDALLVTPINPDGMVPVVTKAWESGIPVVAFNSGLNSDKYTAYIGTDEVEFGYVIAKYLMEQIGCQGNIVALDGIAGNAISEDRYKGLEKAIGECSNGGADVKILGRYPADWAYDKGKIVMEQALAAFPEIDGVWSQGGAMTQGAIEAFLAANRPLVPMTGEDNNGFMKLWQSLLPQGFKAISASEPTWLSAEALLTALKALQGEPVQFNYMAPVPTITADNLDQYVRAEYSDSYWTNSKLEKETADQYYLEKK